jgi:hypothetical protein
MISGVHLTNIFSSSFCENILAPKKCKPSTQEYKKAERKTFVLKSNTKNASEIDPRCSFHQYFLNCHQLCTTKPVGKIDPLVDRWSLFRGSFMLQTQKVDPKTVVVVGRWSLFGGGR